MIKYIILITSALLPFTAKSKQEIDVTATAAVILSCQIRHDNHPLGDPRLIRIVADTEKPVWQEYGGNRGQWLFNHCDARGDLVGTCFISPKQYRMTLIRGERSLEEKIDRLTGSYSFQGFYGPERHGFCTIPSEPEKVAPKF